MDSLAINNCKLVKHNSYNNMYIYCYTIHLVVLNECLRHTLYYVIYYMFFLYNKERFIKNYKTFNFKPVCKFVCICLPDIRVI